MKGLLNIYILMLAAISLIITSCNDSDTPTEGVEMPAFTLEHKDVKVKIGTENKLNFHIEHGGGDYKAYILDESIAKVELYDTDVEIEGLQNGETSLIISDQYSRYRKVGVSVYTTDELQLSHSQFNLVTVLGFPKTQQANVVLGNGNYEIQSDNEAVAVSIDEAGLIEMTAISKKEEFSANVTVTDRMGMSATIAVKVIPSLEPYTDEELANIMENSTRTYTLNGKTDSYINNSRSVSMNGALENGKYRLGSIYQRNSFVYGQLFVDFIGDTSVGTKQDAMLTYESYYANYLGLNPCKEQPVTLKIIKNDGTNIWGVYSYADDAEEKLNYGYFCDKIAP